jgi:hypothetical protein
MAKLSKSQLAAAERVRARKDRDTLALRKRGLLIRLDLLSKPGAEYGFEDYPAEVARVQREIEQLDSQLEVRAA